jgi:hypothetical protein
MLLRQNLCRRHQRRLRSGLDGEQHCCDSHDRFPGANVALQQTVHRRCHLQIVLHFVEDPLLRTGKGKRKRRDELFRQQTVALMTATDPRGIFRARGRDLHLHPEKFT